MADLLFPSVDNPLPGNALAGTLAGKGGKRIRHAVFAATGRPLRGTVLLLQGRNECIEKYFETARELQAAGFDVATFDWRGQGGSERLARNPLRGHVGGFEDYVADLELFFEGVALPDCRAPYFILAHSTGGLVTLLAAPRLVNRIRRIVLSAPLIGIAGLPFSLATARRLTGAMRLVGAGRLRITAEQHPEAFEGNVLTHDRARFERNAGIYRRHPELAVGAPSAGWVNAAARAIAAVTDADFLATIRVPVLAVAAGADQVVSTRAIEACVGRLRSGRLITLDGARHEILQEEDRYRSPFMAAAAAFMRGEDE